MHSASIVIAVSVSPVVAVHDGELPDGPGLPPAVTKFPDRPKPFFQQGDGMWCRHPQARFASALAMALTQTSVGAIVWRMRRSSLVGHKFAGQTTSGSGL